MAIDVRFLLLLLLGSVSLAASASGLDEPDANAPAPSRLVCQAFQTPLHVAMDTRDRSTPLGQWVIDQEARGWQVQNVDFEVAQKSTGFSQGWSHVCMSPTPR